MRYLGYEAVFVIAPGWLALRAISPGTRSLAWQLALGWPLGLTLEVLAFSATAALDIRDLFFVYPLMVGVPAGLAAYRRRASKVTTAGPPLFTPGARWTVAGLCLLAFAYIGIAHFTTTPLPGTRPGAVYSADIYFHTALAAEALHHWPIADPGVAGEPFSYHYFVHLHMAAVGQVTGIDLPTIVTRLYLLPLTALLVLGLALTGRLIAGSMWAGPLTVALFLLVREIDLSISDYLPFAGNGISYLWVSPSQLLGMAMFVPCFVLLAYGLDRGVVDRAPPALSLRRNELWILLAVLLIGAGGAKVVILPTLIGGLGLYVIWVRLRDGRLDHMAIAAFGLCVAIAAVFLLVLYGGRSSSGFRPELMETVTQMPAVARVHSWLPDTVLGEASFWGLVVPAGAAMYFAAPVLGLVWVVGRRLQPADVLGVSLLLIGAVVFFFLSGDYSPQFYFTEFGLLAAFPAAAGGLVRLFGDPAQEALPRRSTLAAFGMVWLSAAVALAYVGDQLAASGHHIRAGAVLYLPVALVVGSLAVLAVRSAVGSRRLWASLVAIVVLLTAVLDTPLDLEQTTISRLNAGTPLYDRSPSGLQPREWEAMEWIRDNLSEDAVLSVSNARFRTSLGASFYREYPAFTERRTFREGWAYSQAAHELGQQKVQEGLAEPFPERRALEQAAFVRADPSALRIMEDRYGVTHIVVSRKDGSVNPRLYALGRLVYSNGAVAVIELP